MRNRIVHWASWVVAAGARGDRRSALSEQKIPRYVHIVDQYPLTVTGKVRKVEMRQETLKLLGLDGAPQ